MGCLRCHVGPYTTMGGQSRLKKRDRERPRCRCPHRPKKQKSCPTPGLPSFNSCPCVPLISFFFPQLPIKLLVLSYSTNLFHKLTRLLFLITKNHKDTCQLHLGELNSLSLQFNSWFYWIWSCWPFISHKNVGAWEVKQLNSLSRSLRTLIEDLGEKSWLGFLSLAVLIRNSVLQLSPASKILIIKMGSTTYQKYPHDPWCNVYT